MRPTLVVRPVAAVLAAVLAAGLLWGESEHWRSSRRGMGTRPGRRGTGEAVVVFGFRNRGTRANAINRWRVRAALRSRQPQLGPSRLVLCGGPVGGPMPEAELMACYARAGRGYTGVLITELTSRTTRENVENVIPFIEDADRIKFVSNSVHAEQARLYLRQRRPDLAERLVPAADYRFGELTLIKPALAAVGRWRLRQAAAVVAAPAARAAPAAPAAAQRPDQIG